MFLLFFTSYIAMYIGITPRLKADWPEPKNSSYSNWSNNQNYRRLALKQNSFYMRIAVFITRGGHAFFVEIFTSQISTFV